MARKIKLAVFDIDGTIFRSSLLIELFNAFIERRIFPRHARDEIKPVYLNWLDRKGGYGKYILKTVLVYLKYIKGLKKSQVDAVTKHVVKNHKDRVYRYTRDLIKQLKRRHYRLIAISGSPDYIVSRFGHYLGFDVSLGTRYEIRDNIFTGRRFDGKKFDFGHDVPAKDVTFQEYISHSEIQFDLKNSIAVGDTEGDIPLLEMVGQPIAFNPNSKLAIMAQKKGWQIVVERKDVVYDASQSKLIRLDQ